MDNPRLGSLRDETNAGANGKRLLLPGEISRLHNLPRGYRRGGDSTACRWYDPCIAYKQFDKRGRASMRLPMMTMWPDCTRSRNREIIRNKAAWAPERRYGNVKSIDISSAQVPPALRLLSGFTLFPHNQLLSHLAPFWGSRLMRLPYGGGLVSNHRNPAS